MTKRSAGHLVEETDGAVVKRPKLQGTAAALELLGSHADQLIECLQALKAGQRSRQASRLEGLSRALLPAFELLGNGAGKEAQAGGVSGNAAETVENGLVQEPLDGRPVLTKWNVQEIPASYPALPAVLDSAIEKAALTHSGVIKDGDPNLSYERLEWIGDAYLYLIASSFIYQTFTGLSPGRCSQLREQLVRNSTLGQFTRHYGLDKRAVFPPEFFDTASAHRVTDKERKKALGDLFEAYVGAVILSDPRNGVPRASSWLKDLWAITIADQLREESYKHEKESQGFTIPASGSPGTGAGRTNAAPTNKAPAAPKMRLAMEIACGKVATIEYADIDMHKQKKDKRMNLPLFTVGCYFTGWGEQKRLLGTGSDLGKKEAGQKAALKALENKKLIQIFAEKKQRFLAEREAADGKAASKDQQAKGA